MAEVFPLQDVHPSNRLGEFINHPTNHKRGEREREVSNCWDLRLEKLSKYLSKIMIAAEGVESKHSTSLKHQE